jgi:uncharacterized protein (TIGR03435 family)
MLSRFCFFILVFLLVALPAYAAAPRVGDPAPPIQLAKLLQAPEGASVSWDSLRGKVVILDFWGSWCLPCRPGMEHLNGLMGKLAGRPVQVVAIANEREEPVTRFLRRTAVPRLWIGLDADQATFGAYLPPFLTTTVVVDPAGRIAGITKAEAVTVQVVEDLLAGKTVQLPPVENVEEAVATPAGAPAASGPTDLFKAVFRPAATTGEGTTQYDSTGRWISLTLPPQDLIGTAFDVPPARLVFEATLPWKLFEAEVRVPEGSEALLKPTLQQMILASLKLTAERERREAEVLVLKAVPGPSALQPSRSVEGRVTRRGTTVDSKGGGIDFIVRTIGGTTTMPVIDETGLTGGYDYFLDWDPEDPASLDRGLAKLGLKLVRERRPVEMLIIRPAAA